MAALGLKYLAYAKMATEPEAAIPTYEPGRVLGKMISMNATVNNSEGELYADDMLAEYASEFTSADLSIEVDNIDLEDQAELLGGTYTEEGEYQAAASDTAPYGGIGGYQVLMVKGVRKFRCWFYPKAKASQPDIDATTTGSSSSLKAIIKRRNRKVPRMASRAGNAASRPEDATLNTKMEITMTISRKLVPHLGCRRV